MYFSGVNIPDELIVAARNGKLVVFAGAGVSMQEPLSFPSFDKLATMVKAKADLAGRRRERRDKEPAEKYLGYLEGEGCDVRGACAAILDNEGTTTELHCALTRLFKDSKNVRVVTTNFDKCFESALPTDSTCSTYVAPALPVGDDFTGIVYLHGIIDEPSSMILTARDFGTAYVSKGWAARFLLDLFGHYTTLFVGYSCNDSLVDYLTRSISSELDGKTFAMAREGDGSVEDWHARGVEAIPYSKHEDLPAIFSCLADNLEPNVYQRAVRVKEIALSTEPLSSEEREFLEQALRWGDPVDRLTFTRAFCSASSSIEHLRLIDSWGLAEFFVKQKLDSSEQQLLYWSIRSFAVGAQDELIDLLAGRFNELSPLFFEQLAWYLASTNAPATAVAPWVVWLESAPELRGRINTHFLISIADNCNHPDVTFSIARMLLRVGLKFERRLFREGADPSPTLAVSGGYYLGELTEVISKHVEQLGEQVFRFCIQQIEEAYSIQTSCWTDGSRYDVFSYSRASIADHEQNANSCSAADVLVEVAKVCVPAIDSEHWARKCLDSRCPLIIRFGLWLMGENQQYAQGLKLVEQRDYLRRPELQPESFWFLDSSWKAAQDDEKKGFLPYLEGLRRDEGDEHADYRCFNVCAWLLSSSDDADLAELRDQILETNPGFRPREHPDFTHYTWFGGTGNRSERQLDEDEFTIEYLQAAVDSPREPGSLISHYDLVRGPALQYPEKAMEMLEELVSHVRDEKGTALARLLFQAMPWGEFVEDKPRLNSLMSAGLASEDLFVDTLEALYLISSCGARDVEWTLEEYAPLCFAISQRIDLALEQQNDIRVTESTSWINEAAPLPAAMAIKVVTHIGELADSGDADPCSSVMSALISNVKPVLATETALSKCLIAVLFSQLSVLWKYCRSEVEILFIPMLSADSWESLPAWEGMAFNNALSFEIWEASVKYWPALFTGEIALGMDALNSLTRAYVFVAIMRCDDSERVQMICLCASSSPEACRIALVQLDVWLKRVSNSDRLEAAQGWLKETLIHLVTQYSEDTSSSIMDFASRWLGKYPCMRRPLLTVLIACSKHGRSNELFVEEGALLDIAKDTVLNEGEKAETIAILVNSQDCLCYEEDAREAVAHIDLGKLETSVLGELQNAYARRGIFDAFEGRWQEAYTAKKENQ